MEHARCMFWHRALRDLCVLLCTLSLVGGLNPQDEDDKANVTKVLDNYQFIIDHIWQWPTYPPDWPSHLPTTTYKVPIVENPCTPLKILKIIKDNDEEMDVLEAKLEAYKAFCEKDKTDIVFLNRSTCFSHSESSAYDTIINDIRKRSKLEKQKFRNGTYLLRDIKALKRKVRSSLVKLTLKKKQYGDLIPEYTFQTRKTEYFDLVFLEKEAKKIRKEHKLRGQLLMKHLKYYIRHYRPTTTRGPIQYKNLPPGLKELVDAGKFNVTGLIRPNFVTRREKHTTNLEDIFRNITTKKWKRLTGPELEEARKNWNVYTPHIYYRKFKTTTPWSITVAVKRELNRRKYERMMNNLRKRIEKGETTRKLKRWMIKKQKNTRVPKRYPPSTKKGDAIRQLKTTILLDLADFDKIV